MARRQDQASTAASGRFPNGSTIRFPSHDRTTGRISTSETPSANGVPRLVGRPYRSHAQPCFGAREAHRVGVELEVAPRPVAEEVRGDGVRSLRAADQVEGEVAAAVGELRVDWELVPVVPDCRARREVPRARAR